MESVQAPTPLCHLGHHLVDIDIIRGEGDHPEWIAENAKSFDFRDAGLDLGARLENRRCGLEIAVLAHRDEGSPCSSEQTPWSTPRERGGVVETSRPFRRDVELVPSKIPAAVEDDGGSLGRVSVLVGVCRHGGDAGEAKIEWWNVVAKAFGPREHETAEAGIGVESDAAFACHVRQGGNRIDHAVWETGGGTDDDDGAFRHSLG